MELKVRNSMPAPATEKKAITENKQLKGRYSDGSLHSDSVHSISPAEFVRDNQTNNNYQNAAYKQNMKNMHSNKANSFFQSRQNRKRNTSLGDTQEHTGSSGYETGTKKARKDSSDSPVFMPACHPVMENMVTSTNEVAYKINGTPVPKSSEVTYTLKEKVIAAAFAIAYNNCKISSDKFQSLMDKPAPNYSTIFAWRQRLLTTGSLNDTHDLIKPCDIRVKPTKVPNPDEIAIITSDSEEECTKSQLPNKSTTQVQQRSDSVETVLLERVEKDMQGAKPSVEVSERGSSHSRNHSKTSHKGSGTSSSDSRNSDSSDSDSDSDQLDWKSTKSKTSTKSGRPTILPSARQSVIDSDSESVSYHSNEENFLSRKFGENKKVRRKFKRRNTAPPPATCSTPENPVSYVPQITQPQTIVTTVPYQGYSTAKPIEKSPLTTGNFYTPNLRNMNAKGHHGSLKDVDSSSIEYVPTRLGATGKNNYQDFKNNVRLNRPGYWARADGATLGTKRTNAFQRTSALGQQNKTTMKRCISTYIPGNQPNQTTNSRVVGFGEQDPVEIQKNSCTSRLDSPNKSPIKKHFSSYVPGVSDPSTSPIKRAINSFFPIETQKSFAIPGLTEPDKSPIKKPYSSHLGFNANQSQKQSNSFIPGLNESPPAKHKSAFIPGFEVDKMQDFSSLAPAKSQPVNQNSVEFTQDNFDTEGHYLPFDKPKKATSQFDHGTLDFPPKQQQRVDQIPLPEKQFDNTGRIFAVVQESSVDKNRSIMDIFDSGLAEKSPEKNNELDKYENVRKPFETEWDEDDDALYGESENATLDDNNASNMQIDEAKSPEKKMSNSYEYSPNKQTDLFERKKETLWLLHNMQMNNENEQSLQFKHIAQQSLPNDQGYDHAHPSNATLVKIPLNDLAIIPEPPPQITKELILCSKDDAKENYFDKCNTESSSTNKTDEDCQKNVRDSKRIHVIESITIEPRKNLNRKQSKQTPHLDLLPVTMIQPEVPKTTEEIEILESSDDQESPAPAPPQPQQVLAAATQPAQTDLSTLLAGINANTLMLALQNLQQLANNPHDSSFSSTQTNPEPEQPNSETVAQTIDTINLTNDEWEKESIGESIERQLEAMDGKPVVTTLSSEMFNYSPILHNVMSKLKLNLKSVAKSDSPKPDENAPVIGNFKSFALPKAPRLKRVKVPIKLSSKSSKKKSGGKRKQKQKVCMNSNMRSTWLLIFLQGTFVFK